MGMSEEQEVCLLVVAFPFIDLCLAAQRLAHV